MTHQTSTDSRSLAPRAGRPEISLAMRPLWIGTAVALACAVFTFDAEARVSCGSVATNDAGLARITAYGVGCSTARAVARRWHQRFRGRAVFFNGWKCVATPIASGEGGWKVRCRKGSRKVTFLNGD